MDMKNRVFKICKYILSLLLIGLSYGIFVRKTGFAIPCIFYRITGLQCPGCGVTRMCLALMRLDFVAAYHYNKLLFIISPVIVFIIAQQIYRYIRFNDAKTPKAQTVILILLIVLLVIWGILRNIF